jgi:hypothetical protein
MIQVAVSQLPVARHFTEPLLSSYPALQLIFAVASNVVDVNVAVPSAMVKLEPQSVSELMYKD